MRLILHKPSLREPVLQQILDLLLQLRNVLLREVLDVRLLSNPPRIHLAIIVELPEHIIAEVSR